MELSRIYLWEVFVVRKQKTGFLKIAGVLEMVLSLHARGGEVFPSPITENHSHSYYLYHLNARAGVIEILYQYSPFDREAG